MPKKIVRVQNLRGVRITVVSRKNDFDLHITIRDGTTLYKKRSCSNCWVKFETPFTGFVNSNPIELELLEQKYDESQVLRRFCHTFNMPEGVVCKISLAPTFYLSRKLANISRRYQENTDKRMLKRRTYAQIDVFGDKHVYKITQRQCIQPL